MEIEELRAFNRTVTERIGALEDRYLNTGRSLALDRLLWEIGRDGADVRDLRDRLGLDSGYLSRQLRALEGEGLVVTVPSPDDARVRRAELTDAGIAEVGVLDDLSDDLVRAILRPLAPRQRAQLIEAAGTVRRLFTASAIEIGVVDPADAAARFAVDQYFAVLATRFDAGFDAGTTRAARDDEMRAPHGTFLVARLKGEVVGCVGLKLHGDDPAEIKRLWVADSVRGLGLGRRLLAEVEEAARAAGAPAVQLDTNRSLTEAIALYRSAGYREIPPFNDEPYAHHWFEKPLQPAEPTERAQPAEPARPAERAEVAR
ncbi:helix-turn-helix domain-containing GNAT family N-acetyltransferase [Microbacterium awajiense]|uniref:Helix-turn-helix domain-containing GNAT family N-acetyltransferase n=1 Tax=Microbacterium awajiense TaxID=415214 RepID=A0ABP7A197_9MICO